MSACSSIILRMVHQLNKLSFGGVTNDVRNFICGSVSLWFLPSISCGFLSGYVLWIFFNGDNWLDYCHSSINFEFLVLRKLGLFWTLAVDEAKSTYRDAIGRTLTDRGNDGLLKCVGINKTNQCFEFQRRLSDAAAQWEIISDWNHRCGR